LRAWTRHICATAQVLTAFAAPERFGRQAILEQYQAIVGSHCRAFFDSLPTIVLVLNRQRQVVFANAAAVAFFKRGHIEDLLGLRPGEALGCVNADAAPGGCGTSRHCRHCGAVQAILEAIDGHAADRDCTLLRRDDDCVDALDMHVWTNALDVNGQAFILCSLTDVSHEKRRRSMERIFFS
jgi:PAS domain-containing protein